MDDDEVGAAMELEVDIDRDVPGYLAEGQGTRALCFFRF